MVPLTAPPPCGAWVSGVGQVGKWATKSCVMCAARPYPRFRYLTSTGAIERSIARATFNDSANSVLLPFRELIGPQLQPVQVIGNLPPNEAF